MSIQLPLDVKLQVVLLGNRHGATGALLERRPLSKQERIEVDRLVPGQLANLRLPSLPAQRLIEFAQLACHCPRKKLRIPEATGLPAKRIRRVIVDVAFVLTERSTVEGKRAANSIICHEAITVASAFIPS